MSENILSKRYQKSCAVMSQFLKHLQIVDNMGETYDASSNPKGRVHLGSAANFIVNDLIAEKLDTLEADTYDATLLSYRPWLGHMYFREALVKFLQKYFSRNKPMNVNSVTGMLGCNAALDSLAHAIADYGDYFMIPLPYYGGMLHYIGSRAGINIQDVQTDLKDGRYHLTMKNLQEAYEDGLQQGHNIRALLLINPGNPSGEMCTKEEMFTAMKFCQKYSIHLICDEILAFSIHEPDAEFTSILSLDILQPLMTHFVWGFGKDFGISGVRASIVYTENADIMSYFQNVSCQYNGLPPLIQRRLAHLITDYDWLDTVFIPVYRTRLRSNYEMCYNMLTDAGITVRDSQCGIFLMTNLSKFMTSCTFEAEEALKLELLENGVYILDGRSVKMHEPGWFRVVFTVEQEILKEGLSRIISTVCKHI